MKKGMLFGLVIAAIGMAIAQPNKGNVKPEVVNTAGPKIIFAETSHNFGTVTEGEIVRYEFKFTNTGTDTLKLENVQASCGCTTPRWPREGIAPGQTSVITAEFNSSGKSGEFNKSISVHSNGGDVNLTISGTVMKEPDIPKSPIIINKG